METVKSRADQRVLLRNISWETYERLLHERGDSRVPRLAYDRGDLEIMSPSSEHESVAYFVALLVAVLAEEMRVNAYGVGSTTYGRGDIGRGFEPDARKHGLASQGTGVGAEEYRVVYLNTPLIYPAVKDLRNRAPHA